MRLQCTVQLRDMNVSDCTVVATLGLLLAGSYRNRRIISQLGPVLCLCCHQPQRKQTCKAALQREVGLPVDVRRPLLGFIGRLDYQKGPDLVLDGLERLVGLDCQVGSNPHHHCIHSRIEWPLNSFRNSWEAGGKSWIAGSSSLKLAGLD